MRLVPALVALAFFGGATAAHAQGNPGGKTSPSKPNVIIQDRDYLRAPPISPATKPYPPPRPELGRPMERIEPLPQMIPRVGN